MSRQEEDLNFGVKLQNQNTQPNTQRGLKDNAQSQPAPNQQQDNNNYNLSNAAHPFACIFTFIFKLSAFLVYFLIGNFFSDVSTFILVVILSALDFWTVKNVTGRLLVGLRWWSDFDENGKEIWRFESYDQQFKSNPVDASFFWMSQMAAAVTWAVFLVLKVLSFSIFWSLLVFINLSLAVTNLWGYNKCRGQHNKKMSNIKKWIGVEAGKRMFGLN